MIQFDRFACNTVSSHARNGSFFISAQLNHRLFFMSKQALYRGFRIVYHRLVGTEKEFRLTKPGKDAL